VKKLLAEGCDKRSNDELAKLLEHSDARVRQESQFALATRGDKAISTLATVAARQAKGTEKRLARLHAFWALGQIARTGNQEARETVVKLMVDHDSEVRAQAMRVLGDASADISFIVPYLKDAEPRVRCIAALAIARTLHLSPISDAGRIESTR